MRLRSSQWSRTGGLWDSARRHTAIMSLPTKRPPLSQSGSGFAGNAPMRLFNILRSIPHPRGEEPLSLCLRQITEYCYLSIILRACLCNENMTSSKWKLECNILFHVFISSINYFKGVFVMKTRLPQNKCCHLKFVIIVSYQCYFTVNRKIIFIYIK